MPVKFTDAPLLRLGRTAQLGPENTLLGKHDLVEPATAAVSEQIGLRLPSLARSLWR
jgi:hypothetical protein